MKSFLLIASALVAMAARPVAAPVTLQPMCCDCCTSGDCECAQCTCCDCGSCPSCR